MGTNLAIKRGGWRPMPRRKPSPKVREVKGSEGSKDKRIRHMTRETMAGKFQTKKFWRQLEQQRLGSHGAASEVRHVDPTTYQAPAIPQKQSPPRRNKTVERLREADAILVKDAKRRYGRRFAKRTRNQIVSGRYR